MTLSNQVIFQLFISNPKAMKFTANDQHDISEDKDLPLQRTSIGVDIFFSEIFSYFCFFVAALSPCHGKDPRLKYIKT